MADAKKKPAPEPEIENEEEGEDQEDEKTSVSVEDSGDVKVKLAPEPGEKRPTRKEKREDRYGQLQTEVTRMRERSERMERDLAEARAEAQRIRQEAHETARKTVTDPIGAEMENVRQEQESIQLAMRSATSPADVDRLKARFYQLEDRKDQLRDERTFTRLKPHIPAPQPEGAAEIAILRSEHGDVMNNPQAAAWAEGRYRQLRARGEPGTIDTARRAFKEAAEEFGLARRQAPAPTEAQRARYGAPPSQAGGKAPIGEVSLSKAMQKMATSMYPTLDENEAYARWAANYRTWSKENPAE